MVIAFSGGVDSTFLLAVAHEVLGDKVLAVTATSAIRPDRETREAGEFAQMQRIRHLIIKSSEMENPDFISNGPDRCYHCKKHLAGRLLEIAHAEGMSCTVHGENADDLQDYRPGLRAARESGMVAPLADVGLSKEEIRFLAREMGLAVWDKPAAPCLATRIPYGSAITSEKLRMVEEAEGFLLEQGFGSLRVRHHGSVARLEVSPGELDRFLDEAVRFTVTERLRQIGFEHAALDLEGYKTGKMNRGISKDS